MFLKEALTVLAFGASTLGISGFAVKISKFEYNYLFSNKLNLSIESYKKLKLRKGDNFYYSEDQKPKLLKISDIQVISPKNPQEAEHVQLTLVPKDYRVRSYLKTGTEANGKIIKYLLETKSFWRNLFE